MIKYKIFLLIAFTFFSISSFSQSLNNKTDEELEIMKKEAITSENFDLANKINIEQSTRVSLDDLLKELNKNLKIAVDNENYDEAEKIKIEINKIEEKISTIKKLEEEKKAAILIEDFDKVIALDKQIAALKNNTTDVEENKVPTAAATVGVKQPIWNEPPPVKQQSTVSNNYKPEFNLFKNGLYMDAMAGVAFAMSGTGPGIGYRIGNKWYFGSSNDSRFGFQVRWAKVGLYLVNDYLAVHLAPVNVGAISLFKLSETTAIEANLTFGFNLMMFTEDERTSFGFMTNPSIKFRYKKLAMGLDYSISSLGGGETSNGYVTTTYSNVTVGILSLTFGLKF